MADGFSPRSLPGLAAWFDVSQAAGVTTGAGGIASLNDLSGNARHLAQGTSTKRPALTAAGQAGRDIATFDGIDDALITGAWAQAQPLTLYIACKITANSAGSSAFVGFSGYGAPPEGVLYCAAGLRTGTTLYAGAGLGTIDLSDGAFHSLCAVVNGGSSVLRKDAAEITGAAGGNAAVAISLGDATDESSVNAPVAVGEFIVYTAAHNATERAQVIAYLKSKWATP